MVGTPLFIARYFNLLISTTVFLGAFPLGETTVNNHFSKMKRDIGMENYEIQGKQEAAHLYPIR